MDDVGVLSTKDPGSVDASVRYINAEWRDRAEAPRIGSKESRRANTSFQAITVHNARPRFEVGDIDLDRNGFTLSHNRSTVSDFRDDDEVRAKYHPQMQALIERVTGADRTFVYNHLVRTETPIDFNDGYARFVHCDYNMARLEEMSHGLLAQHGVTPRDGWSYAWYNTWQPFDNPAYHNPLTCIDWQSLPEGDVIDYYYTGRGRESRVAAPVYNPDHRWCYFPEMSTEEVLILKQLDGRPGRACYCPHVSFDNKAVSEDLPPRRSIETRLLAVFENTG